MRTSVRTTLALVSAAVTSMVAIAFLVPLAVIVRDVARDRAFTSAQLTGAAIEPVLSVTTDRATLERAILSTPVGAAGQLGVYLTAAPSAGGPAGQALSNDTFVGGQQHASAADLRVTTATARSAIAPVPGGYVVLQPVALGGGRLAVTEVYVPAAEVSSGVTASWAVMAAVALALIGVSVIVADRLAVRVTRPASELAAAAATLGNGDLSTRSTEGGPAELAAAGHAFNVMADHLSRLIAAERAMAADLPHRLRTPLTALRMNAAALEPGQAADGTRVAIDQLEREIDLIIRAARRPAPDEPSRCDAAEVFASRFGFWSALAEDQARPCHLTGADRPAPVPVPRSDLAAAADSLIGNVFRHTAEGTGFAVTVHRGEGAVLVLVADAGPGIADPDAALRRGFSGAGSTGLGLDIARRVAESTGGGLKIGTSALGGAQVQMRLRTWSPPPGGRSARRHGAPGQRRNP
jgi:signal transduction histidine kinase